MCDAAMCIDADGCGVCVVSHLVWAGGLVCAVVVTVVLVSFGSLRFPVGAIDAGFVDRRDVVAQRDGLHRLVDAAAHTLAHLGRCRLLGLAAGRGSSGSGRGAAAASTTGSTAPITTGLLEGEQDHRQRSEGGQTDTHTHIHTHADIHTEKDT